MNCDGVKSENSRLGSMKIVVDSHQHFWDPAALRLPPFSPSSAVLARPYMPAELEELITMLGINGTVLVQGYPQTPETNRWYFSQANAAPFVRGVVAWIDLEDPARAGAALDDLRKEPKFVGIRHVVEGEPDVGWIVREPVMESLGELTRQHVAFDMVVKPQHLENVLKVLDKVPHLPMVIDHIAKPNIAKGGSPGWAEHMAAIAKYPQVYCKLSGMVTEADWGRQKPTDLRLYVAHVVDVFGWDRVMYGSDWPVCLLASSYQGVWQALHEALGKISDEQHNKVFGANAIRFYRLRV